MRYLVSILFIFLLIITSSAQRGFKTDLGLNPIESNMANHVIEHENKYYCSGQHADTITNTWNTYLAIFNSGGQYLDHHFLRNDTVSFPNLNNYVNYNGMEYTIHGISESGIKLITYNFEQDTFYTSDSINHFRTLITSDAVLINQETGTKYGCGDQARLTSAEKLHRYLRIYKIDKADTLYHIDSLVGKEIVARNARLNNDGNLVVLGGNSFGSGYRHIDSIFVTILDDDLKVIHSTLREDSQAPVSLWKGMCIDSNNEIVCTHNNRYLKDTTLVGDFSNDNLKKPGLTKFDKSGRHLWSTDLGNNINNMNLYGVWNSVVESPQRDGYVMVGGESYMSVLGDSLQVDAAIAKVSYEGDSLWMRRYSYEREGAVAWDIFTDVYPTSDGGYVATGGSTGTDRDPNPFQYTILMKLDSEGKLDTTGTDNIIQVGYESDVKIYPNPTNGPVYITNDNHATGYYIDLLSSSGQLISSYKLKSGYHTMVLDSDHFLDVGVYFLRMRDDLGAVSSKRLVITR